MTNQKKSDNDLLSKLLLFFGISMSLSGILAVWKNSSISKEEFRTVGKTTVHILPEKMSMKNTVAETEVGLNSEITVKTDKIFNMMPRKIQDCILAHEIGHHVVTEAKPPVIGRSLKAELAADAYAASICGKATTVKMLCAISLAAINPEVWIRIIIMILKKNPMKGLTINNII